MWGGEGGVAFERGEGGRGGGEGIGPRSMCFTFYMRNKEQRLHALQHIRHYCGQQRSSSSSSSNRNVQKTPAIPSKCLSFGGF